MRGIVDAPLWSRHLLLGTILMDIGIPSLVLACYLFLFPPRPEFCYVPANWTGPCPPIVEDVVLKYPLFIVGIFTIGYGFIHLISWWRSRVPLEPNKPGSKPSLGKSRLFSFTATGVMVFWTIVAFLWLLSAIYSTS